MKQGTLAKSVYSFQRYSMNLVCDTRSEVKSIFITKKEIEKKEKLNYKLLNTIL